MQKVISIRKGHDSKRKSASEPHGEGFDPCSPDMTLCGDCVDSRAKKKCPRLKEWLAKRQG